MLSHYVTTNSALIYGGSFAFLSTIGILGNMMVLAAVLGSSYMHRSPTNLFLVNLAIADSLFILAHLFAWLPRFTIGTSEWVLPWELCPLTDFLLHTALYASIFTYIAISIERYVATVYSQKKIGPVTGSKSDRSDEGIHRRTRRVIGICISIWMVVSLWWAPNAYATRVREIPKMDLNNHHSRVMCTAH